MVRILSALLVSAACLVAVPASACARDGSGDCGCKHEKKASKAATPPAATAKKAAVKVKAADQMIEQIDSAIAGKCSCSSAGDCTCKKGTCKCSKCNHRSRQQLIQALEATDAPLEIPANARRDATAGAFI